MAAPGPPSAPLRRPARTSRDRGDPREPDEIIGEFRRGSEIGKGSFATVHIAKHMTKKSLVAIKVVPQSKLNDKLKTNLHSEINILNSIHHPHIVALFSCTETTRFFYLVMEYCHMSDLAQFMKKRRDLAKLPETADIFRRYPNPAVGGLNEVLVRHFIKQIVSALQFLRSRNLIHRDIKPQNLLLNPAPSIMARQEPEEKPLAASKDSLNPAVGLQTLPMLKIADFGFARHLPSTALAETLCGSPLYMAPEILRYEKYDARADLWSTGTVLHEMVVGKPPFRAQNHVELLRRIEQANDQIPFDRGMVISRDMKTLVRKLLKKSPLDRVSYEHLFMDTIIVEDIPNLAPEDRPLVPEVAAPDTQISEISRSVARRAAEPAFQASPPSSSPLQQQPTQSTGWQDPGQVRASKRPSDQDLKQQSVDGTASRRHSVVGTAQSTSQPQDIRRPFSQRQQRRPSIVPHMTSPGRQELLTGQNHSTSAPKMERRPSRSSPLAGPPMVREPSIVRQGGGPEVRVGWEARERSAQDMQFEREYVVIEKRAVEVNAFADELDANANVRGASNGQGAMVRRATTQGHPTSVTGAQPPSPSREMQIISGRPHQRTGSFERRYPSSPQSATNMLSNALKAANVRLFGVLGTSPPLSGGPGPSPPYSYTAFPAYPVPQAPLLLGDGTQGQGPMDEDSRIVRTIEEAGHRSNTVYDFAEIKYQQLVPAAPSAQALHGGLGPHATEGNGDILSEEGKLNLTPAATVEVAEEALVLYVKVLSVLVKIMDLAGTWWQKQPRGDYAPPSSRSNGAGETGKRMNNVVQWARNRYNECLEKSELVSRKLEQVRQDLPEDHPGHPNNYLANLSGTNGQASTSAGDIQITSGITAENLLYYRAVDMSKTAAMGELMGGNLEEYDLCYATSIQLLETVLETDDEPLTSKLGNLQEKSNDNLINGLEAQTQGTIQKLIEDTKLRRTVLRKRIRTSFQPVKQRVITSSSVTPRPSSDNSQATPPTATGTYGY